MIFIPNNDCPAYEQLMMDMRFRYYAWTRKGQPGNDIDMYGILEAMNQLPGVTTVYCCESHPKRRQPDRFYVMCVANPEGVVQLGKLVDACHRRMDVSWPQFSTEVVNLIHTRALMTVRGKWVTYPAYVIECQKVTRKGKREFLWQFLQAVEEVRERCAT